jgi:signal transduction histidine kinase
MATLVAGGVAMLAWVRYTQTEQADSLFQAAAFLTLCVGGAIPLAIVAGGLTLASGYDRHDPGQVPLYVWSIQRLVAGVLLLVGALVALRGAGISSPLRGRLVAIAPALLVLLAALLLIAFEPLLPALVDPQVLAVLARPAAQIEELPLSVPMLLSQGLVALLFFAAAAAYLRVRRRSPERHVFAGYLAASLVVAGFSQLHYTQAPGNYAGLLTSGDVLRAAFYGLVLVGVTVAARDDLAALRRTNAQLVALQATDRRRAALEERARLAREIHDGVVQDLWLARLTHGDLLRAPDLPDGSRELAARVDGILEDALAEARQAIIVMQPRADDSFGALLARLVEDYGDRFGQAIEYSSVGASVQLDSRAQAELLRICREALANARKHADATLVRVELRTDQRQLWLRVSDDGRGFDPERVPRNRLGLQAMRERARGLGARLAIDSADGSGTTVTVELDLARLASAPAERG